MHITDRLYNKKWGIFNHYLYGNVVDENTTWNEAVHKIDVKKLAQKLHEMGAGYYFITLCQGTRYLLAPNETYNKLTGALPGEACSDRDVISELYEELEKYGIDLYLYFPSDGPHFDKDYGDKIGFCYEPDEVWDMESGKLRPAEENKVLSEKRLGERFIKNWSSVLYEYSMRYGKKIAGWWLDGFYDFFGFNNENMKPFYEAAKAGNPDAIVAFNGGVREKTRKWYINEEYTAGEFNELEYIPESRFTRDGAQNHILAPLGSTWGKKDARYSNEYMRNYISRVNKNGGVVTVDIKIYADGSFEPEQIQAVTMK